MQKILRVLHQSAVFERLVENHLAPVALHLGVAFQRLSETCGIVSYLFGLLFQLAHRAFLLLMQTLHSFLERRLYLGLVLCALLAALAHGLLECLQTFFQWCEQSIEAVLIGSGQFLTAVAEHLCGHTTQFLLQQLATLFLLLFKLRAHLFSVPFLSFQFLSVALFQFCPTLGSVPSLCLQFAAVLLRHLIAAFLGVLSLRSESRF